MAKVEENNADGEKRPRSPPDYNLLTDNNQGRAKASEEGDREGGRSCLVQSTMDLVYGDNQEKYANAKERVPKGKILFSELRRSTQKKYIIAVVVTIMGFLFSNISLNISNKRILSETGFIFPIFFVMCHSFMSIGLGFLWIKLGERNERCTKFKIIDIKKDLLSILCVSAFFALNVSCNNESLLTLGIPMNQIIRSSIPTLTAIFSMFIQNKRYTGFYWIGIVVSSVAVMLSVYGNPGYDGVGFAFAMASGVFAALQVAVSGRIMQEGSRLDPINALIWQGLPTMIFCIPLFAAWELMPLIEYTRESPLTCLAIVGATGLLAFVYNAFHYELIAITSSVFSTIIGNFKTSLVIGASEILLGKSGMTPLNWIGVAISLLVPVYSTYLSYKNLGETDSSNLCFPRRTDEGLITNPDNNEEEGGEVAYTWQETTVKDNYCNHYFSFFGRLCLVCMPCIADKRRRLQE